MKYKKFEQEVQAIRERNLMAQLEHVEKWFKIQLWMIIIIFVVLGFVLMITFIGS